MPLFRQLEELTGVVPYTQGTRSWNRMIEDWLAWGAEQGGTGKDPSSPDTAAPEPDLPESLSEFRDMIAAQGEKVDRMLEALHRFIDIMEKTLEEISARNRPWGDGGERSAPVYEEATPPPVKRQVPPAVPMMRNGRTYVGGV